MVLVSRLRSATITCGRRFYSASPMVGQLARAPPVSSASMGLASASSPLLSSSSSMILQQTRTPTRVRIRASNDTCLRRISSPPEHFGNDDDGAAGGISTRSRFKEIPVHPSILQYIKRVGIGREGKGNRRKKKPFGKKKKQKHNNSKKQKHFHADSDTMSREEERQFLGNGRVARRSGGANSATKSSGRQQQMPPPPSSPPPFGEGQQQRQAIDKDHNKDSNGGTSNRTIPTKEKRRNIRVLPVKVIGRVTSSSGDDDEIGETFPRPTSGLPEVAIVGRSNVGKSTLLNALLYSGRSLEIEESEADIRRRNRRLRSRTVPSQTAKLPRGIKANTSSKPGETRSIDFYQLSAEISEEDKVGKETKNSNQSDGDAGPIRKKTSLLLVDLPGYGFAFGPKKERNSDGASPTEFLFPWQKLIETYITNRPRSSLKRVLLLIDSRHGMKPADAQFLELLQRALMERQHSVGKPSGEQQQQQQQQQQQRPVPTELPPLQIVLTKCDLVSQIDLARRVVQVRQQLSDCLVRQPKILPEMLVSAQIEGHGGVLELQKELASLCGGSLRHK